MDDEKREDQMIQNTPTPRISKNTAALVKDTVEQLRESFSILKH